MVSPVVIPPTHGRMKTLSVLLLGYRRNSRNRSRHGTVQVAHDFNGLREIMDFLKIDCSIVCGYHMDRFNQSHYRLLKVVLPTSFFEKQMLRRAPHLPFFMAKGLHIGPLFPKEESDRLKREREVLYNILHSKNCNVHDPGSRPMQSCNDLQVVLPSSTQSISLMSDNEFND